MTVYNPNEIEKQVASLWKRTGTYEKTKKAFSKEKPFFFMDGPPYATASIHLGTAWNKIIKDAYIRFWRMQGFNVWDQPGYDTHGTPIEVQVEKTLGFNSKKDIEKYGTAKFIKKCREYATKYIDVMSRQFEDLGVWMDWKRPYLTLENRYIEGAWFTFKQAFQNGHLYRGSYPVHVCTRCETVVAYNEIEHRNVSDRSVYVKFPVKGKVKNKEKTYLVIWTTTPWTLPANTGVMVHPDYEYAYVEVSATKERLIVAKELARKFMTDVVETGNFKIVKTVKGKDLDGMEYEHPLKDLVPALQNLKKAHRVVLSSRFVNLDAGTGLVHTAPGHGAEDWQVGREKGLPIVSPVNLDGTFKPEAGKWVEGKYTKDTDSLIIEKLSERNVLVGTEDSSHEYPHCWRCDTPLLFLNVPQWFFKVKDIRNKLLEENKKVNWIPKWAGQRFNDWLENLDDWPISRQRYWGIPLPIWDCTNEKCKEIQVIGSWEELRKRGKLLTEIDFHRPAIDKVKLKCVKCGKPMERVKDVMDVWFDSGVATWASLEYPRQKGQFNKMWPSDFQLEGPDQFRGWWNSEMITSYLTFKRAPFKNVLLHGFVMDARGSKMSKSKGNVVLPEDVVNKYGRDTFRFFLLSSPLWNDFYFNWDNVKETSRMFNVLWNTYLFVKTYGGKQPDKRLIELKKEDKWIISRMNSLIELGRAKGKSYEIHDFVKQAYDFILNDFSRWYIKIIRERVSPWYEGKDKQAAQYAMHYVLGRLLKVMVPITPFITEKIWLDLYGKAGKSIHFEKWPAVDKKAINGKLEKQMETAKLIFEAATAKRQEKGIKLRWPLASLSISGDTNAVVAAKSLKGILTFMLNVKDIKTSRSKTLSIRLGVVLKDEALLRELIRKTQSLRKGAKLLVKDQIALTLETDGSTEKILNKHKDGLLKGTGAKSLDFATIKAANEKGELTHDGKTVRISFRKA
jgi:isoleucyl-tRNA synthetase